MRIIAIAALAFVIGVPGCAKPRGYVDENGIPVPERVLAECRYEAMRATAYMTGLLGALKEGDIRAACLRARGYREAP